MSMLNYTEIVENAALCIGVVAPRFSLWLRPCYESKLTKNIRPTDV